MMNRWDNYFWEVCNAVARNSKCKSRQIGAIIVRDKAIISTGYNGPPRGMRECGDECPRHTKNFKSGEGLELCPAAHAEANAIAQAARNGINVCGTTMYMSCPIPCKNCLSLIINAGIIEVVCDGDLLYDGKSRDIINQCNLRIRNFYLEEV